MKISWWKTNGEDHRMPQHGEHAKDAEAVSRKYIIMKNT